MVETAIMAGIGVASFAAGIVVGRIRFPRFSLKPVQGDPGPQVEEGELAQQVLRDVRSQVVEETIRLRDMAKSDDPVIEDEMRNIAKGFLMSNRRFFQ